MNEPIVLIGGFGSHWQDYMSFARLLRNVSGKRVYVTSINRVTWLVASFTNYHILLERLSKAVQHALQSTAADRVVLIGHSAGGVVARSYLADRLPISSYKPLSGYRFVSRITMLGSPLRIDGQARHTGMRHAAWIDHEYPGSYYSQQTQYLTVYGKLIRGDRHGTAAERGAFHAYKRICGEGNVWGDGVVPNHISRLDGAPSIELDGVGHSPGWGDRWYGGDASTIRLWWSYFEQGDAPAFGGGVVTV